MEALGYYNGKIAPLDEMTVPMNDRGFYFGDGIYEAALSVNGVIFTLEEHINRFFQSAALVRITPSHTREELAALLTDLVAKVDAPTGGAKTPAVKTPVALFVYWQWTRGTARRDFTFPAENAPANLAVMIKPAKIPDPSKKVRLITAEDIRFLHCNIKTLNLLPACMAAQKAKEAGAHEAVLFRHTPNGDIVTECSHSNVHIIKEGIFITHPADNYILRGIARQHLLSACYRLGIPVLEKTFTVEELYAACEIITSSASTIALAANEIDGRPVGGKASDLLAALMNAVHGEIGEACGASNPLT